ncbi:hypothetical protein ACH4OY_20735 [Micromonospora rubida]|uniref:SWIM-type domain-containing protein n=1 Tax=Micromonospora rubida TaxID=2697657 RepID=A0ABW7SS89_9ACTN
MAVHIDIDALRGEAGAMACDAADKLLAAGQPAVIVSAGGGASCVIREAGQPSYEVWVGVMADGFTAQCDCPAREELCAHAVALTVAAVEDDFNWSSAAALAAPEVDPRVAELAEVARDVPAGRLALLVAEWAATDRVLENRLLAQAGQLVPLTAAEADEIGRTIDTIAHEATIGEWDLHDIEKAGRAIVEEVRALAERPATQEALPVVERAARAWDRIVPPLLDAWETYEEEPGEIGGALRAVHVNLCEQVQPDPDELAQRLADVIGAAEVGSCLDEPWDYLGVLGRDRVKALRNRR